MSELKKVALVTGGSGYVGDSILQALSSSNWHVINISRTFSSCPGIENVVCNCADENEVRDAVQQIVRTHPTISAFIHAAAAPIVRASILDTTAEQFDSQFEVSVRGLYLIMRELRQHMEEGAACIGITTRSIEPNEKTERRIGAYLASKQAERALLRSLAAELEPHIRVYAVAPGFMPGGLNSDLPEGVRAILGRQRDGTPGSAKQVGEVVAELCIHREVFPAGVSISLPSLTVTPLEW